MERVMLWGWDSRSICLCTLRTSCVVGGCAVARSVVVSVASRSCFRSFS